MFGSHVIEERIRFAGIVEWQDVRMLQSGCDFDLVEEPLAAQDGGQLGTQDLYRDLAVVFEIVSQVDHRHPALAYVGFELVAIGQGRGETLRDLRSGVQRWFGMHSAQEGAHRLSGEVALNRKIHPALAR